jgi:hypothetical protein
MSMAMAVVYSYIQTCSDHDLEMLAASVKQEQESRKRKKQ